MSQTETMDCPPNTPPTLRRRRWRLWVGMGLVLFLIWMVLLYGLFTFWTDRELREAMAAADRDLPGGWQLEDIEAHRPLVPEEENAALVVLKVESLLPANWPMPQTPAGSTEKEDENDAGTLGRQRTWDEIHELPPEIQLDAALKRALEACLQQAEPARAEARKLIGMTRGRFPMEWSADVFQTKIHSQATRSVAYLLRYEAALASQNGDADNAAALVRGLLGTARSIGDEPLLVSALTRLAGDAQAVDALERVLGQGEPSGRELAAVQALLEQEASEPLLVRGLRGKRAGLHKYVLSLRRGDADLSQFAGATGAVERKLLEVTGPTLARRSHGSLLQLLNEYVEAAQLPPEQQPAVMDSLNQKVIRAEMKYDIVTGLLMPAMNKVAEANRRGVGNLRCAFVAVALERYRRDQGRWPDTLAALVPKYLAAVPADPQDGKPLRFRRRRDGVVVYWIGHDGTDDGGKIDRLNYLTKGSDQGFRLWDVTARRRQARELLPPPKEAAP